MLLAASTAFSSLQLALTSVSLSEERDLIVHPNASGYLSKQPGVSDLQLDYDSLPSSDLRHCTRSVSFSGGEDRFTVLSDKRADDQCVKQARDDHE